MRRRVVCGLSETIATLPPASAFTSVDLPTLGRPATATKPDLTARRNPEAARGDGERESHLRAGRSHGRLRTRAATGGSLRRARRWPAPPRRPPAPRPP